MTYLDITDFRDAPKLAIDMENGQNIWRSAFPREMTPKYEALHVPATQQSPAERSVSLTCATSPDETATGFTPLEWDVVELARMDPMSSLWEDGRLMKALRLIFGWERKRPLADPRLEALRRMAVMSWHHGYNVHSREIDDFRAAGYSLDHYETLLGHIGRARTIIVRGLHR